MDFSISDAAAIGIIGGADGPAAIYVASMLAPDLLGAIARGGLFLYGVGAVDPATDHAGSHHRGGAQDRDGAAAQVSRREKIVFPLVLLILVALPARRRTCWACSASAT